MIDDVTCVLGPLPPFIADWKCWDLELTQLLDDVLLDVTKRMKTRGVRVGLIDLPELGKSFDFLLSREYFLWERFPKSLGSQKSGAPLARLVEVFLQDDRVSLVPDLDPNRVFFMRTLLYFFKKYKMECSSDTIAEAFRSFIKTDQDLADPVLSWDSDWLDTRHGFRAEVSDRVYRRRPGYATGKLLSILESVSSRIASGFGEVSTTDLVPRNGPGAVAEGTKFRDKFRFDSWPSKLEGHFPADLFASSSMSPHDYLNHEPPARVLAVPKTLKSPRIITAEPHSYQYCQQAMLRWMRQHMPSTLASCIDFSSQELSRALVLEASRDGSLASIDLSEASDRLSLLLVEFLLGSNESLLRHLHACRSRWVSIEGTTYFKPKKYAGMGNATTFPVQSVCYAMLCIACIIYDQGWVVNTRTIRRASRQVRVFGDDLIVPSRCVSYLAHLMLDLGLKVNVSKTHWTGYFRESCGMDAYRGSDVTPFYLREGRVARLGDLPSWIEVSNNAYRKGLWNLADWMVRQVPSKYRRIIPVSSYECFSLRLHSFQDVVAFGVRTRFDKRIHAPAYRILTVTTSEQRMERHDEQSLLQYFVEAPSADQLWSSGWVRRAGVRLNTRWVSAFGR